MIGSRFGNWMIEQELGRGGMGRVYLAHEDPPVGPEPRKAAVKVLAAELAQDPGFLQRFQREVEVLGKLDHPNIVHFFDAGCQDGNHFYAMEYVAGQTFDEILLDRGRLPWKEVLAVALQVCAALKHAHNHGIIHRDIKPPNLMCTDDGVAKLTDFGIAKVFAGKQLTATGALVGTAEYLSPEQASGKAVTARSDLYSFGCVLYTLLTGRTPFQGQSILDLLHKHRFAQFDPPRKIVPDLPYEIDELVCNLLDKDPAGRPANAMVLQRKLESIQRQLERKERRTVATTPDEATQVENVEFESGPGDGPGPATLMSRLVREELERQQRGNALAQFLNRPWVVASLFVVCVGLIAWRLWPPAHATPQALFEDGSQLMASENPGDWVKGWKTYLEPLEEKYPNHPYHEEIAQFRLKYTEAQTLRRALQSAHPVRKAERLYQKGIQRLKEGDLLAALTEWRNVVREFGEDPKEQEWVALAREGLKDQTPKSLQRARELREQGKQTEAEEIWRELEKIYGDDARAKDVREQIGKGRGGQAAGPK